MIAKDLIGSDERAVALCTSGEHFHVYKDDTGETGHWPIGKTQEFDKVIVFHTKEDGNNDVWIGDYVIRLFTVPEEGRYKLILKNCRHLGSTTNNWKTFANTNQNPVRYIPYS
jgi:hypothetical protein